MCLKILSRLQLALYCSFRSKLLSVLFVKVVWFYDEGSFIYMHNFSSFSLVSYILTDTGMANEKCHCILPLFLY
jgi:hypothetical protein